VTELHQILAVEKGTKARVYRDVTDFHHQLQVSNTKLSGITRTYQPKDEEGDRLPPESTLLQLRATEVIERLRTSLTELFDITLTKDTANQEAAADIIVDNDVLATDVPVSYLLFLEKQLVDLTAIISKLPVLDPAERWEYDDVADAYTTSSQTTRTKKILRNHVKAPATDKHPAQVEVFGEDTVVGYWTTTKFSGALPQLEVNAMKAKVIKLSNAVKSARETANSTTVTNRTIGSAVFGYLFD
jgi:hypothetical protein